jgi:hypothetical protein
MGWQSQGPDTGRNERQGVRSLSSDRRDDPKVECLLQYLGQASEACQGKKRRSSNDEVLSGYHRKLGNRDGGSDCGKLFNRIPEARMELEYTHSWKLEGILKVNIDRQDRRLKTGDSSLLIIQNLEG